MPPATDHRPVVEEMTGVAVSLVREVGSSSAAGATTVNIQHLSRSSSTIASTDEYGLTSWNNNITLDNSLVNNCYSCDVQWTGKILQARIFPFVTLGISCFTNCHKTDEGPGTITIYRLYEF